MCGGCREEFEQPALLLYSPDIILPFCQELLEGPDMIR